MRKTYKGKTKECKYYKGLKWDKPLTSEMEAYEKETGKNAIYRGVVTGSFEYWLYWRKSKKPSKPRTPKPKPKTLVSNKIKIKYPCTFCGKLFTTEKNRINHINTKCERKFELFGNRTQFYIEDGIQSINKRGLPYKYFISLDNKNLALIYKQILDKRNHYTILKLSKNRNNKNVYRLYGTELPLRLTYDKIKVHRMKKYYDEKTNKNLGEVLIIEELPPNVIETAKEYKIRKSKKGHYILVVYQFLQPILSNNLWKEIHYAKYDILNDNTLIYYL